MGLVACKDTTTAVPNGDAQVVVVREAASDVEMPSPVVDAGVVIVDADVPDVSLEELIDRGLGLLEDTGAIVQANLGDCDAMGDRLEEYRQSHLDIVKRVETLYDEEREAERKALQPKFRARFKAAWAKIRPGVLKCRKTPKVSRVIMEVWGDDPNAAFPDAG